MTMFKRRKNLPIFEHQVTKIRKKTHERNFWCPKIILQHSFSKIKSLLPPSSVPSPQAKSMAYNTIPSMEKLTFTDYVEFGNCQYNFGLLNWSKNDFNYLDVKLKVLKKDDNKEF